MNRAFVALLTALTLGALLPGSKAPPAFAATAPGRITFLAASCPASSSMYQRVAAGQDPNSNENGNAADPADIAAYGCAPTGSLGFFLLANSTEKSLFLDDGLTKATAVSSSESGPAGATIIQSGATAFVPGGVAQTRRFSVANYPTTITSRAAMPFLDLQCLSDGYNSDNADGAGWSDQAIAAGSQAYCIAYVWDGVAASTPTATATVPPSPSATPTTPASATTGAGTTGTPGLSPSTTTATVTAGAASAPSTSAKAADSNIVIEVLLRDGGGNWKLTSSPGEWSFKVSSANGKDVKVVHDGALELDSAVYEITFAGGPDTAAKTKLTDFELLESPATTCGAPDGNDQTLKLTPADFKKNSSIHICAFLAGTTSNATVKKTFVKADETTVTWKLQPSAGADLLVWDTKAESCEEFNGASCEGIAKGNAGGFSAKGSKDQYLLVTQSYKKDGESCSVKNTAEWAPSAGGAKQSVEASYVCSGAPTMGWPLFALFIGGALGMAVVVRRKMRWPE